MIIRIEKLPEGSHVKQWVKLTGGTQFKNVGFNAEIGYSSVLDTPPADQSGEILPQGATTELGRGDVYAIKDAYFSYEFMPVG